MLTCAEVSLALSQGLEDDHKKGQCQGERERRMHRGQHAAQHVRRDGTGRVGAGEHVRVSALGAARQFAALPPLRAWPAWGLADLPRAQRGVSATFTTSWCPSGSFKLFQREAECAIACTEAHN